jgi:hypothetical protein
MNLTLPWCLLVRDVLNTSIILSVAKDPLHQQNKKPHYLDVVFYYQFSIYKKIDKEPTLLFLLTPIRTGQTEVLLKKQPHRGIPSRLE